MPKFGYVIVSTLFVTSILLVNSINPVFPYEVSFLTLIVNIDGSVEINQMLKNIAPGENITVPLLGDPIYIEILSKGLPQPAEIQDTQLIIIEPLSEEITIKYIVTDLTNKMGEEWILTVNSQWETGIVLPDEAIVLDVSPDTFNVDIVNNSVVLLFSPGKIAIKYILVPSAGEPSPESPLFPSYPIVGDMILFLITLVIILSLTYIVYRFLYIRKRIQIIKSVLDERDTQIIKVLTSHGELTAKEIMDKTGIPKTPLYRRLKRLAKQGYIEQRTVGGVTYYGIRKGKS